MESDNTWINAVKELFKHPQQSIQDHWIWLFAIMGLLFMLSRMSNYLEVNGVNRAIYVTRAFVGSIMAFVIFPLAFVLLFNLIAWQNDLPMIDLSGLVSWFKLTLTSYLWLARCLIAPRTESSLMSSPYSVSSFIRVMLLILPIAFVWLRVATTRFWQMLLIPFVLGMLFITSYRSAPATFLDKYIPENYFKMTKKRGKKKKNTKKKSTPQKDTTTNNNSNQNNNIRDDINPSTNTEDDIKIKGKDNNSRDNTSPPTDPSKGFQPRKRTDNNTGTTPDEYDNKNQTKDNATKNNPNNKDDLADNTIDEIDDDDFEENSQGLPPYANIALLGLLLLVTIASFFLKKPIILLPLALICLFGFYYMSKININGDSIKINDAPIVDYKEVTTHPEVNALIQEFGREYNKRDPREFHEELLEFSFMVSESINEHQVDTPWTLCRLYPKYFQDYCYNYHE